MKKKISVLCLMCLGVLLPTVLLAQAKQKVPANKSGVQTAILRGKLVYSVNCLSCHQADGSGVPNLNPPLSKTEWVTGAKIRLIQMVLKGSSGQVEIDGETFNNSMPAQAHLTDQQIADVLTYVRNTFGNKASAVAPAEVKAMRAKIK